MPMMMALGACLRKARQTVDAWTGSDLLSTRIAPL
jgi:hypothetical protein